MHTLACYKETLQKLRGEFVELRIDGVSHKLKHLLYFLDKDDFFGWTCDWPELKKSLYQWNIKLSRLLEVVLDTKLKLCVIGRQCLNFMERDEHALEKDHVLLLERHCKT